MACPTNWAKVYESQRWSQTRGNELCWTRGTLVSVLDSATNLPSLTPSSQCSLMLPCPVLLTWPDVLSRAPLTAPSASTALVTRLCWREGEALLRKHLPPFFHLARKSLKTFILRQQKRSKWLQPTHSNQATKLGTKRTERRHAHCIEPNLGIPLGLHLN